MVRNEAFGEAVSAGRRSVAAASACCCWALAYCCWAPACCCWAPACCCWVSPSHFRSSCGTGSESAQAAATLGGSARASVGGLFLDVAGDCYAGVRCLFGSECPVSKRFPPIAVTTSRYRTMGPHCASHAEADRHPPSVSWSRESGLLDEPPRIPRSRQIPALMWSRARCFSTSRGVAKSVGP